MRSGQSALEMQSNDSNEAKQPVSLDLPGVPARISAKIAYDINDYAMRAYYDAHRWHLGASLIGHECSRYLWYTFRWCGRDVGSGETEADRAKNLARMQRLYNRGHREEDRYVEYLRGIGAEVWTHDTSQPPDEKGEYPQFRISLLNGHYGGSADGVIRLPPRYQIDEALLGEFKTNGTGQGFTKLVEKGVALQKPQHFVQMSTYGRYLGLRYGAYFNTNKNDDDMHVEVVKLNWPMADQMTHKAERIITSQEPPPRISETPTYFKCGYCPMKPVCHEGALPERNCRSCRHATPSGDPATPASWYCDVHNAIIPREYVPVGCPSYGAIVNAAT